MYEIIRVQNENNILHFPSVSEIERNLKLFAINKITHAITSILFKLISDVQFSQRDKLPTT